MFPGSISSSAGTRRMPCPTRSTTVFARTSLMFSKRHATGLTGAEGLLAVGHRSWAAPHRGARLPPAPCQLGTAQGSPFKGREFRVLSLHLIHISHEARLAQVRAVEEETSQYHRRVCRRCWPGISIPGLRTPLPRVLAGAGWVDAFVEANGEDAGECPFHRFEGGDTYKPKKGRPGVSTHFPEGTGIGPSPPHW